MTVFFRTTGSVGGPGFFVKRRGGAFGTVRMPVTVAVLERPDGLVLIDAGWSRYTCAWPERDPGRARAFFLGLDVKPEDAMASQLLSLGYSPDDVRHVVATHLHIDHIGGAVDLPNATVHASREEWTALGRGRVRGYDPRTAELPSVKLHALEGPPLLGFASSEDLFGDGTVFLLDARGHTRGSVAVAVKLTDGWAVHVGDAAMFAEDYRFDASVAPSPYMRALSWDVTHQRETFRHILAAETEHGARVVTSHDMSVYEPLPHTKEDAWAGAWSKRGAKGAKNPKPSPRNGAA
jgi:glyoxylase-like metal-dependent hydrolase (beta-lactamase superfamily II)